MIQQKKAAYEERLNVGLHDFLDYLISPDFDNRDRRAALYCQSNIKTIFMAVALNKI